MKGFLILKFSAICSFIYPAVQIRSVRNTKIVFFSHFQTERFFFLLFEMSFDSFLGALYKYAWSHTVQTTLYMFLQ